MFGGFVQVMHLLFDGARLPRACRREVLVVERVLAAVGVDQ
jgi:hypothetical protein